MKVRPLTSDMKKVPPTNAFAGSLKPVNTFRYHQPVFLIDFTGTLSDDEPLLRDVWENVYKACAMEQKVTSEKFSEWLNTRWYGVGIKSVHDDMLAEGLIPADHPLADYDSIETMIDADYQLAIEEGALKLRTGMAELIAYAKENGIPMAIITNDKKELVERKLKALGLSIKTDVLDQKGDFLFYVSPENVGGLRKPDPALYVLGMKMMERFFPRAHHKLHYFVFEDNNNGLASADMAGQVPESEGRIANFRLHYPFTDADPVSSHATARLHGHSVLAIAKRLCDLVFQLRELPDVSYPPSFVASQRPGSP